MTGEPSGPAVVLLHGFMGSAGDWDDVAVALRDRFLCVAVDLPGHGVSLGLSLGAYTMEGAARGLLETLDNLGIEDAAFVGYSMGGRLALYLALRHPERCSALFLESATPGMERATDREERRVADEERAASLESGDFETFLGGWYRQPLFASLARDGNLLARIIETRCRNDPAELARSLRGMGTGNMPSLWGELAGLQAPTLAVAGELDEKFAGIAHRMEASTPRLRSVLVPDAGHNVRLEAHDTYLALLREALERWTKAPPC